jgi:hypothetical protein
MEVAEAQGQASLAMERLAEIAQGPRARVDLCRATLGGETRLVAVKRLLPELTADVDALTRFRREMRITSALRHANVVEVVAASEDAEGPFFALELVQGVSLARLRKTVFETREEFSERLVVYVAACICRGLAAAHGLRGSSGEPLGLVHRDLNLDNVLVSFAGEVKIADFGFAKAKLRATGRTGAARPSLQMAPEEVLGQAIDERLDLFSLGVMLFELLTKRPPWNGKDEVATLQAIAHAPAPDLAALRPRLDRDLVDVVTRCLAKDPARRPASAQALVAAFDGWLDKHGWVRGTEEALGRFVRRNAMRQMRWFEQAIAGTLPRPRAATEAPAKAREPAPPSEARPKKTGHTAVTAVARRAALAKEPPQPAPSLPGLRGPTAKMEALRAETAKEPPVIRDADTTNDDDWDATTLVQRRPAPLPSTSELAATDEPEIDVPDDGPTRPLRAGEALELRLAMASAIAANAEVDGALARLRELVQKLDEEARTLAERAERVAIAARLAEDAVRGAEEARALVRAGAMDRGREKLALAVALGTSAESTRGT